MYWRIGLRIGQEILEGTRAEYGAQIVSSLIRQLSWTHFLAMIYLPDPLQREFYAELCRIERWSTRTLRKKISSMLYERTALSRKPAELAKVELQALREEDRMTPDIVFRDPYLLDFLGLKDIYQERDLEMAILRELESFILELGVGFTFVARQRRITVDCDDFYLDLLFFHRDLRRLVALELKLDKFRPAHKGQMELYIRWLDKNERKSGEEAPLGIILCAGKESEQIELLELRRAPCYADDQSGLRPRVLSCRRTDIPIYAIDILRRGEGPGPGHVIAPPVLGTVFGLANYSCAPEMRRWYREGLPCEWLVEDVG